VGCSPQIECAERIATKCCLRLDVDFAPCTLGRYLEDLDALEIRPKATQICHVIYLVRGFFLLHVGVWDRSATERVLSAWFWIRSLCVWTMDIYHDKQSDLASVSSYILPSWKQLTSR
jgi:hypothetical protein